MSDVALPCVVDTNIIYRADQELPDDDASAECIQRCALRLREISIRGHIVIDKLGIIVAEYNKKPRVGGSRVGDQFVLWVLRNQWNPVRCTRMPLTQRSGNDQDFDEFPNHPGLVNFDPSDRVFIAVAYMHPHHLILAACDTDHWVCRRAICECGINIEFLCEEDVRRIEKRNSNE